MTPSAHTIKELWLAAMQGEGRSPYTRAEYRREVTRLLDAYPAKTIFDIDTFDVEMHLTARCAGLASATRRKVLAAISGFFDYLEMRGRIPRNPCRPIKRPLLDEPEPTYWTADELKAILAAPMSARDHLLLETFARTGQRSGVVRTLRWQNVVVTGKSPHIDFPKGKGGKVHTMPMHIQLLRDMLISCDSGRWCGGARDWTPPQDCQPMCAVTLAVPRVIPFARKESPSALLSAEAAVWVRVAFTFATVTIGGCLSIAA
jgi:integrase